MEPNKAHPVGSAIDGTERWWQSPPLSRGLVYNEVNVTLDLGQVRNSRCSLHNQMFASCVSNDRLAVTVKCGTWSSKEEERMCAAVDVKC